MLILFFSACTVMGQCRDERIVLDVAHPMACLRVAQPRIAEWSNAHPGYGIVKWRCGAPPHERRA
jgi:hypothetical protein